VLASRFNPSSLPRPLPSLKIPRLQTDPETTAWNESLLVNPHEVSDKRRRVQRMFAAIAPSYDLNNRLHSFWMDQSWRRKAVRLANLRPTDRVVDVACGTGDLSMAFLAGLQKSSTATDLKPAQVIGIDFTQEMLPIAVAKWNREAADQKLHSSLVHFIGGDAQNLPLPDECCDVASIAFGIRNVVDPFAAVKEFFRILRPGGRAIILEFSIPTNPIFRGLYNFYFKQILPRTATLISGDKTGAYKYLPQSVRTFINRQTMVEMLARAGFSNITQHPLTMGICVCYLGVKV
jgi:demethylmenaquinone methyltransferase / 2-methoxy-6-polyprenyl-1,4-benzoquinol methylase